VTLGPRAASTVAVVGGDSVFDPTAVISRPPGGMREVIERWTELQPLVRAWWEAGPEPIGSLSETALLAPILDPGKILTVGNNYRGGTAPAPASPPVSAKLASAIIGPADAITWDSSLAQQVDYEVELAVVIGRVARHLEVATALDAVFGYTCLNDVAARDPRYAGDQWLTAKSLDTFCPLGPCIVTKDEVPEPNNLALKCEVSGDVLQAGRTSETYFSVEEILAFLSHAFTLYPGDIISTGTPPGTGVTRHPPRFLRDGDVVAIEIERIGRLENRVQIDSD
jgi:2-keto-4-pentenoate hydratase/2-oxohepta-3-ene-1,7-dioic acid hydratase in catechol pathway